MRPGIIAVLDVVVMYFSSLAKSAYKNNKYTVKWQRSKMLRCSDKSKSTYGSNKRTDTMTLSLWTLVCDYIYIYVCNLTGQVFPPDSVSPDVSFCFFVCVPTLSDVRRKTRNRQFWQQKHTYAYQITARSRELFLKRVPSVIEHF